MPTLELILPKLHQGQQRIDQELKRFNVMACGRRFGKDVYEMNKTIETALSGYPAAFGAPTYKVLSENWRSINMLVAPIIKRRDAQERRLELVTGGVIDFWSLDNPDMIRGRKYKRFVINEAGFVINLLDIWNYIIRPTLVDFEGDAILGGTPKGRNGFWNLYQRGLGGNDPHWNSWQMSSYENPFVPASEIDEMVANLPELVVRQEVYAEFLEDEGAVIRNIAACMGAPIASKPELHTGHTIIAGLDWAKQNDFTATSVGCATCRVEVERDRFNQIDYHFQYKRISDLWRKWGVKSAMVEVNSIGEPGFEALQREGLPVMAFTTTASSKPQLIENMALAFERAEWQFQADPVWTGELEAYERKVSPITGRSQYSAPEGMHDDTVIARALMLWASGQTLSVIDDPFAGW
jgi:hypothetical protein